jgi:hypothetical protein
VEGDVFMTSGRASLPLEGARAQGCRLFMNRHFQNAFLNFALGLSASIPCGSPNVRFK